MTGAPASPVILRIRTMDDQGKPIVDASVLFKEAPVTMPDIAALTNESGEVVLAAPVPGAYTLESTAIGFDSTSAAIDVGARDEEIIEMVLTPVTDAD